MLTLFFSVVLAATAQTESPEPPKGLNYKLDANTTFFSTEGNYRAGGGTKEELVDGGSFKDLQTQITYIQDLDSAYRVQGGFSFAWTESNDGTFTRTNSGLNEILLGGQYWTRMFGLRLVPQADLAYPLWRVDENSDDALLGEGAIRIRAGSWALWRMGDWTPFGFLAFEYRDEGRAYVLPYSLGAKYSADSWWLQGEYRGYERIADDADSEARNERDIYLNTVQAGSYRYYAINPSLGELALAGGLKFGGISIYGGVNFTVTGSSAADGWGVTAGLSYSPRIAPVRDAEDFAPAERPVRREEPEPFKTEKSFPEERYFKETPEPQPKAQPAVDNSPMPSVELRKKKKPKPKPKKKKGKSVDQMLKDTERELENM